MKYLLLVRYSNTIECFYFDNLEKSKEYAKLLKNYIGYNIYELNKTVESVLIND